MQAPKLARN